ncbi:hypothetical protein [Solwaraspora sp. WMMD792]|nr:hypothetical protein [Solwaraspora sp. WMMD792]MDG4771823.1 hypothetical protein [Solwaraspora sp. WMMD792]
MDEAGIAGDRAFAVLDCATGKVASAKNPRLWRDMLTVPVPVPVLQRARR